MERPSRRLLYILMAVFVVLLLLRLVVSGFIGIIILLAMAGLVVYFAFVAYKDFERTRSN